MRLYAKDTILFIGDSITDAGRLYYHRMPLGTGYPQMIAAYLLANYPDYEFEFINRGISGNTLSDMAHRWQEDCLNHQPDLVSILIGINDIWQRKSDYGGQMSAEDFVRFEETYWQLLTSLQDRGTRMVILEPFLLPYPMELIHWRPEVLEMKAITASLAEEFGADYLPLDQLLNEAGQSHGYRYYSEDGIHPNVAGHGLIAREWLKLLERD